MERDVHDSVPCVPRHIVTFGPGNWQTRYGVARFSFAGIRTSNAILSSATRHAALRNQRAATSLKDSHAMATPTLPDS
jgi:hypothetical protein